MLPSKQGSKAMNWMTNALYGDFYLTAMGYQPPRHPDGRKFADMTPAPQAAVPTASERRSVPDAFRNMFARLSLNWRSAS